MVYYYIPEDLDELTVPNAYMIPKELGEITLGDVEKHFPLSKEFVDKFHFRFKYKYNDGPVWLDLNNKKIKVPKYESPNGNKIILMKVTRVTPKFTLDE